MKYKINKKTGFQKFYKICVNCGAANEFTGAKLCIECGYPHDRRISNIAKKIANWLTK